VRRHGSDRVDRGGDTRRMTGDAYGVRYSLSGLTVLASKPSDAGLRVWASKPGRGVRGGTNGMWRHRGVRVEAKVPVRRRGGRRINMKTGLDLYVLGLIGLALMYSGAFRKM
jgi:hypothetical protein